MTILSFTWLNRVGNSDEGTPSRVNDRSSVAFGYLTVSKRCSMSKPKTLIEVPGKERENEVVDVSARLADKK